MLYTQEGKILDDAVVYGVDKNQWFLNYVCNSGFYFLFFF